ncbi:hypothetical protein GJ654_10440 [Rhodoblastus acidophilus]|uniref:Calx-beta domain-containing protein n=1 Tax=Rhodoblastus acidophilus TaxID=1074 RepID=A0A6N8DLE0_RHOAC|nr:Calx-beta domain-containing protein [Rhodoblastus acidophilus]MCW2275144.1 hypothetical protein [Rhodoblastus acidophilus]MTV31412.1 hypothetical protein [Rhodoblastus acidophilus]
MSRSAVFVVTLSKASTQTVTVAYTTAPGTAVAPSDFTAESGTLTFLPGQTTKQIMVPVRDTLPGTVDEEFTVVLSAPTNATLATSSAPCTIPGEDALSGPVVSINNVSVPNP